MAWVCYDGPMWGSFLVAALVGAAGALSLGCAGTSSSGAREPAAAHGTRGVRAAALPYRILRARGGSEVSEADLLAALAGARAVCIGEHHPNPHDHWAQLHLLEQLVARNAAAGVTTGLGMEMFQRPFQGVLDDLGAGRIDQRELRARTGWAERWGYDFALYEPMIALSVSRKVPLVALNTARELTKRVSRDGLAALSPDERRGLPELVLDDPDHRAWWDAVMSELGGPGGHRSEGEGEASEREPAATPAKEGEAAPAEAAPPAATAAAGSVAPVAPAAGPDRSRAERIYTAQVLWDETMADAAAAWLGGGARRQLVILAGSGHCHESAIVRRLERRGVGEVMSVRPLIDRGDGELPGLLARPQNDFLFVMTR
jgi:uncharacterized iron-regulated protein